MDSIVGRIIATSDVEQAVTSTIEYWIDYYLSNVEYQNSQPLETIARPASYNATYDFDNWPEGQLPAIAVVCPGTTSSPERNGNGDISAWFDVELNIIVTGQTEAEARTVAALYQAALATLLMQQAGLNGAGAVPFATDLELDGYVLRLADTDNRTLAVGTVNLRVFVFSILNADAGPPTGPPPDVVPTEWPTVETVNVTVTAEPIGD